MKKKNLYLNILCISMLSLGFNSCSDFLDEMPDNRTTLDNEDKISDLLTASYPDNDYLIVNELMSDNMDYFGEKNSLGDLFGDQVFFWEDVTEADNDSPEMLYMTYNQSIAQANQALVSIDELGGATTDALKNDRGEALMLRAFCNFVLVNEFCKAYSSKTADSELGLYYSKQVEKFSSEADRGTLAEDYANIAADIEEAIPLLNDNYTVPRYHFTKKAAYAFAARFYLFYEKWDKAVAYANLCLGSNPASQLRDYDALQALPMSRSEDAVKVAEQYVSAEKTCNLLIMNATSSAGYALGPWGYYKRYSHDNYLADYEDISAGNVFDASVRWQPFTYQSGNSNFSIMLKIPFEFQYTDQVARTGYRKDVNVFLSTDETLLNRAEAYVMLKQYDKAAEDLNTWAHNFTSTTVTLTPQLIQTFYNSVDYSYDDDTKLASTIKKHLHPNFDIDAEGSMQECMLQCVLGFKRMETLHQGLRWWDIKRYNIVIPRRLMGDDGTPSRALDWLQVNDDRQAIQIPQSIIEAGVEPNPRSNN